MRCVAWSVPRFSETSDEGLTVTIVAAYHRSRAGACAGFVLCSCNSAGMSAEYNAAIERQVPPQVANAERRWVRPTREFDRECDLG